MANAFRLPEPPGDRLRGKPRFIFARTAHATKAWRSAASTFNDAARAWRRELEGRSEHPGRVADFAAWRRLRHGEPATFEAYDQARTELLATPGGEPEDLCAKLSLAAELLGLAEPSRVLLSATGATPADVVFSCLWAEAKAVQDTVGELRRQLRAAQRKGAPNA